MLTALPCPLPATKQVAPSATTATQFSTVNCTATQSLPNLCIMPPCSMRPTRHRPSLVIFNMTP